MEQRYKYIRHIKLDLTLVENIKRETIAIRQCTEPTLKVRQVYDLMDYRYVPFYRKKSVVPPAEIFKDDSS